MTNEEHIWAEEDIGRRVQLTIGGVSYYDTIVEVCLPDGQIIIGPMLKCGQIFARFVMTPQMMEASEATKEMYRQMTGDDV